MTQLRPFLEKRKQKDNPQYMENLLPKEDLFTILRYLKPLRQACCHFQIGNQLLSPNQHVMSLMEIQENLRNDVHNDCETALRDLVACRNAIAGIYILQKRWKEASDVYRETLDFCAEQKKEHGVETDALQQIHCLFNMVAINDHSGALSPQMVEETKKREQDLCQLFVERSSLSMEKAWRRLTEPSHRDALEKQKEQTESSDRSSIEELGELTERLFLLYEDSNHIAEQLLPPDEEALLVFLQDAPDDAVIQFCKVLQSRQYGSPERRRPGSRKITRVSEFQQSVNVQPLLLSDLARHFPFSTRGRTDDRGHLSPAPVSPSLVPVRFSSSRAHSDGFGFLQHGSFQRADY